MKRPLRTLGKESGAANNKESVPVGWLIVVGGVVFVALVGSYLLMQVAQQIMQAIP